MINQRELSIWLTSKVADLLEHPEAEVDPSTSFADLGLSSLQAVQLTGDIEEEFGMSVPPMLVYEFPSVSALSAELASR